MKGVFAACTLLAIGFSSCKKDSDPSQPAETITVQQVVDQYADVVSASYTDIVSEATKLQTAIHAFAEAPTPSTFDAAKAAWIEARMPYGRTEAYRFYDGPIDGQPDNLEAYINSWPLDESYLDYVDGDGNAGIINNPTDYPEINDSLLNTLNQSTGEEAVTTGWHAIEFLLWGQDLSASTAGTRPFTDFVAGGTAANQHRRSEYLVAVTDLLIKNLQAVADQWKTDGTYRKNFTASANVNNSLKLLLTGIGSFSKGELGGERMKAYITKEQEDEQSCFSDNTTNDHIAGQEGIMNVYYGRYTKLDGSTLDGPGVDDLVKAKDTAVNDAMTAALDAAYAAVKAIPAPFDQAILAPSDNKVQDASTKVQAEGDELVVAAGTIGITITL